MWRRAASVHLTLLWLWFLPIAHAVVDCSVSPNCTERGRLPCDPLGTVENACGDCLVGNHGGPGPLNTFCMPASSCAALYPGAKSCSMEGSQLPLIIPLGRCVCDSGDAFRWPTSPGSCAKVSVASEAPGDFQLETCSSESCESSSCTVQTRWSPATSQEQRQMFQCKTVGSDHAVLTDNCSVVIGDVPASAFCGHPGFWNIAPNFHELYVTRCQVAPRCPKNVQADNLDQTCCFGAKYSYQSNASMNGLRGGSMARGFCASEPDDGVLIGRRILVELISGSGFDDLDELLLGKSDPFCEVSILGKPDSLFQTGVVHDRLEDVRFDASFTIESPAADDVFEVECFDHDVGDSHDALGKGTIEPQEWRKGFDGTVHLQLTGSTSALVHVRISLAGATTAGDCAVRTSAKQWKGCACLASSGLPKEGRVCTMDCTLDSCGEGGKSIPPTPDDWLTSESPQKQMARIVQTSSSTQRSCYVAGLVFAVAWLADGLQRRRPR